MARILRGDICWADLDPTQGQAGRRPVLVLSQDVFNDRSGTVIAVALTSRPQKAGFPLTLELSAAKLPKKAWVKDQPDKEPLHTEIGKESKQGLSGGTRQCHRRPA